MEIRVPLTNALGYENGCELVAEVAVSGGNFIEFPHNEAEYVTPPTPLEVDILECWVEKNKRMRPILPQGLARELIEEAVQRKI